MKVWRLYTKWGDAHAACTNLLLNIITTHQHLHISDIFSRSTYHGVFLKYCAYTKHTQSRNSYHFHC